MTRNDVVRLFKLICALYPGKTKSLERADEMTRDAWFEMLHDQPNELVGMAVKKHAATEEWPPTPANIRGIIAEIKRPDSGLTAAEGWRIAIKALRRYGPYRFDEARQGMPPIVVKACEQLGWSYLGASENEMADRAHFLRIFEELNRRAQERAQLPAELEKQITQLTTGMTKALPADRVMKLES